MPTGLQYDITPGFDLFSVASPTRAQHVQAIAQLAPLSNIGGVVYQAGTSLGLTIPQGTGGSPDVTNNPRFARYIWLNTFAGTFPSPYYYNTATGNWTLVSVAPGSIVDASVAVGAAIAVAKLAAGTARYLLRTNSAGTSVEYVSPAGAFNTGELPEGRITPNGVNGYLKTQAGVTVWVADATERAAIVSGISSLAPSSLSPGANNTVLGTNGSGDVVFDVLGNIIAAGGIGLSLLNPGGGAAYDSLRLNAGATAWEKVTQSLRLNAGDAINQGVITPTSGTGILNSAGPHVWAHGLGGIPKLVRVVVQCTSTDINYAAGDEVELTGIGGGGSAANEWCAVSTDATNITIVQRLTTLFGQDKTTGADTAIDETKWRYKVYAWK